MRICEKCGASVEETERSCPFCGNIFEQVNTQPPTYEPPYQTNYNQSYQAPVQNGIQDKYQGFPMKWYKFLVYFALWAGALLNAVSGVMQMTGKSREKADIIYSLAPSLKTADIIFGILLIGIAVLGVITALKLLKLSSAGPKFLLFQYGISCVVSVASIIIQIIIIKNAPKLELESGALTAVITNIVFSTFMIAVNWIYFKKRESIFVN